MSQDNSDKITSKNLNEQIVNLTYEIDRFYREIDQTDPPLDATYLSSLPQKINDNYSEIGKLALSMLQLRSIPTPKPLDSSAMTDAGIIPDTPQ